MAAIEVGRLTLPEHFSPEPDKKRQEFWELIDQSYKILSSRFSSGARRPWVPSPDNIIICGTSELMARVSLLEPEAKNDPTLATKARGYSSFSTGTTFLNESVLQTPVNAAVTLAHETIHQWWGLRSNSLKVKSPSMKQFLGSGLAAEFEYAVNESLVQYSAMEGLGLLEQPITDHEDLILLTDRYNGSLIKQLAVPLEPDSAEKIFLMTQGKYPRDQIASLDRRIGRHKRQIYWDNFFEWGFLYPAALLSNPSLDQESLPEHLRVMPTALLWIKSIVGKRGLDILGREDVQKAAQRLETTQRLQAMFT